MFALGSPRNGKNLLFQKQFQIYISDLLFRVKLHFKEMLSLNIISPYQQIIGQLK